MSSSQIEKLDSKGRIVIPAAFRSSLRMGEDSEVLLSLDSKKASITITPVSEKGLVELLIGLPDMPGSLAKMADVLALEGVDLVSSESRTLSKGNNAEWKVYVNANSVKDLQRLKKLLNDAGATYFSSKKA